MVLIIIVLHAQSNEVRNKAMETVTTLKTLLEWQAMKEITDKLDEADARNMDTIKRVHEPRATGRKFGPRKKKT